jgi:V-type H+-transporting ATPase subunit d
MAASVDLKLQLSATDYGNFLQNESSPITTTTIVSRCSDRMVQEFLYLRAHATQPLAKFLDYITHVAAPLFTSGLTLFLTFSYGYMIDNVILLITGTLHSRDTNELLSRCNPLGVFETMAALCVATNVAELYNTVLVETPLGLCRFDSTEIHFHFPE